MKRTSFNEGWQFRRKVNPFAELGGASASYADSVLPYSWAKCAGHADVVLYEVAGGGHTWPDTDAPLIGLGTVTHEINASSLMWDFFESHPRRG